MLAATGSTRTAAISAPCSASTRVERVEVVVGHDDRVGDRARRDARRAGQPERRDAAARPRRAARRGARGSSPRTSRSWRGRSRRARAAPRSSRLRCPTTRAAPSRPTAPASQIASASSTSPGGRRAVRRAVGRRALHRLDDRRVRVAEDRRAPRLHVVDVARGRRCRRGTRPRARATKNGSPPTEPNARTGEFDAARDARQRARVELSRSPVTRRRAGASATSRAK